VNSGIIVCINRYGKAAQQDSHSPRPGRNHQMYYFKACTKCEGDLTLEKDSYGAFLKYLQCGKSTEVNEAGGHRSVLHGATFDQVAIQALTQERAKAVAA
jgi:hypothetical protein